MDRGAWWPTVHGVAKSQISTAQHSRDYNIVSSGLNYANTFTQNNRINFHYLLRLYKYGTGRPLHVGQRPEQELNCTHWIY